MQYLLVHSHVSAHEDRTPTTAGLQLIRNFKCFLLRKHTSSCNSALQQDINLVGDGLYFAPLDTVCLKFLSFFA